MVWVHTRGRRFKVAAVPTTASAPAPARAWSIDSGVAAATSRASGASAANTRQSVHQAKNGHITRYSSRRERGRCSQGFARGGQRRHQHQGGQGQGQKGCPGQAREGQPGRHLHPTASATTIAPNPGQRLFRLNVVSLSPLPRPPADPTSNLRTQSLSPATAGRKPSGQEIAVGIQACLRRHGA
jgi:hypothetical protein